MMRVLVAVDGSTSSELAVNLVRAAPWPDGTVIRVITAHLVEPAVAFRGPGFVVQGRNLKAALADETESIVVEAAERLERGSLVIEREVLHGFPVDAITDDATRFGADLLVIGSRGHGPLSAALLGSVSAGVVDRAPCPVLVARRAMLRQAVLAYDGSPASDAALSFVARSPLFERVSLTVISVVPLSADGATNSRRLAQDAARELRKAGRQSRALSARGDPAGEILRIAGDLDADLLVTGSRGHGGLSRLVLGSVARRVLLHTHASVLIVR